jgi:hypothetical protein
VFGLPVTSIRQGYCRETHENTKENTRANLLKVSLENRFSVRTNTPTDWYFALVGMSRVHSNKGQDDFTAKFFGSIFDCNKQNSERQFVQDNIIRPKIVAKKMETGNMVAENLYLQWHSFN